MLVPTDPLPSLGGMFQVSVARCLRIASNTVSLVCFLFLLTIVLDRDVLYLLICYNIDKLSQYRENALGRAKPLAVYQGSICSRLFLTLFKNRIGLLLLVSMRDKEVLHWPGTMPLTLIRYFHLYIANYLEKLGDSFSCINCFFSLNHAWYLVYYINSCETHKKWGKESVSLCEPQYIFEG